MRRSLIFRLLFLLLALAAAVMLIPLVMALAWGEEGMILPFLIPVLAVLIPALPVIAFTGRQPIRFSAADGFLLVFFGWVLICLLGAFPYYLSGGIPRFSDAVFESVSGFTTTGATVIPDVESLPRSLLFWRAMTHWLGGMGIVVLTVALLPLLGVGGFQLIKAETTGPEKEKITAKITETAKILWLLYTALIVLQTFFLMLGGMDWFDALTHAFSTAASGGFSVRNNSIAAYHSPWIEGVCTVFMLLAAFNFTMIYRLIQGKYREVLSNSEIRAYGLIILVSVGISVFVLLPSLSFGEALGTASFHVASILSTTGFSAADYSSWPPAAQGVLFFLLFVGGCSGSTAGGIKVIRHVVLAKQAGNEMKRLLYPQGVFSIRLNGKVGSKSVVYGVAGFVFLYLAITLATTLLVSASGLDLLSSLSLAALCLGNIGIGLGADGPGAVFQDIPALIKWVLSFVMIAGRLELWTALVFFSRAYWRQ